MSIQGDTIIGTLVAENYRAAGVFRKYGIDFCCQGNRTIGEACEKKSVSLPNVIGDLNDALEAKGEGSIDYRSWPIDLLADYIEKKHHRYVRQKSAEIKPYLDKICRVHGGRHPELLEVKALFDDSVEDLLEHMEKEERVLLPHIRKMAEAHTTGATVTAPFGSVSNPITAMMEEHTAEGERFRQIAELTNNYQAPEDACNTYRVTFALINEYEQDLHLHIHIENNILFPRAIELEKKS